MGSGNMLSIWCLVLLSSLFSVSYNNRLSIWSSVPLSTQILVSSYNRLSIWCFTSLRNHFSMSSDMLSLVEEPCLTEVTSIHAVTQDRHRQLNTANFEKEWMWRSSTWQCMSKALSPQLPFLLRAGAYWAKYSVSWATVPLLHRHSIYEKKTLVRAP